MEISQEGVNLAVFSAGAKSLSLCLFAEDDLCKGHVTHEIALDPVHNKTGDIWHVALPDLDSTLLYGELVIGHHLGVSGR